MSKMSKILELCFGVVLLAIAINGDDDYGALKKTLTEMANSGESSIHGKFWPLKDGFFGEGGFSVVFKGKHIRGTTNTSVAMKFFKMKYFEAAKREYEMYTYLNAIDNPSVEKFGIPNVYYYNEWNEHMIMVFSYFDDGDLVWSFTKGYFIEILGNRCINSLILFREFVRQSKYMHSLGVRHDDIKPENIMIRKHRSFLIDFNGSSKMNEKGFGGSIDYVSRRLHKNEMRNALDDWESFLYTMCRLNLVRLEWFDNPRFRYLVQKQRLKLCGEMKEKINETIARIESTIRNAPLKRIFLKFAHESFKTDNLFPDYDGMYDAITAELSNFADPWFIWLTPQQKAEAKKDLNENPLPNIENDISDPREFNNTYPFVNYEYFHECRIESDPSSSNVLNDT